MLSRVLSSGLGVLAIFSAGLAPQAPFAVKHKQIITPQLSHFVEKLRAEANIPGLTLGLVHADGQAEYGAWGIKDEDGTEMTPETSFILASCSKAFVATAMGILIDDFAHGRNVTSLPSHVNVFDYSTKVKDLLPEFQLQDKWTTKKASIKDMLSHVTGVPRHDYAPKRTDSARDVLLNLRNLRPAYELREQWSYNNLMFMSASYLITTYAGKTYAEFVKERIFTPLGMSSSTYSPSEATRDFGLTEAWTGSGRRLPTWFTDEMKDLNAGPGGVISTAKDMTKWLRTYLNEGVDKVTNTTIIPKSAYDIITTATAISAGRPNPPIPAIVGYGLGWDRTAYAGHEVIFHTGGIPGFSTFAGFLPSDDLGIVVLINADAKDPAYFELVKRIVDDAFGAPTTGWDIAPAHAPSLASGHRTTSVSQDSRNITAPSLAIEKYAGKYWDAGMGDVILCAPTSTSPHCLTVLDAFSVFDDIYASENSRTLYAAYPTLWSDHLRVHHVDGDDFNLVFTALFPTGHGKNTTPFETWEKGEAEAPVKFELADDPITGEKEVAALAFMGTPEEQEGRARLQRSLGPNPSISALAEVLMTRVGPE